MTEYDYLFKLILIGDPGVGKTSILYRYTEQTFGFSHFALIGVDFKTKTNEQDSKTTNLQIWDLAGQGRFRKIHPSFYRLTSGFLIVFALNNKQSFDHVRSWHVDCEKYRSASTQFFLVGAKSDLSEERQVSYQEAVLLAEELGLNYIEVSALTGHNINTLFDILSRSIRNSILINY